MMRRNPSLYNFIICEAEGKCQMNRWVEWGARGGESAQQVVTSNEDGCGKKGFKKTYFCEFEIKFQTIVPQCKWIKCHC